MNKPVSKREQLLHAVALEFDDDSTVFTGFHWPVVGQRVARRLHAPELRSIFEAGIVYGGMSDRLSTSTTEVGIFHGQSEMYGSMLDTLHSFLKSGRLDGAVVDAANVDRFGNVNSTVLGEYNKPKVRLPGPGGANDILSYCEDVVLVCGSSDPERYHDRVSYISSPGHLDGDGSRENAGFAPGTGPSALVTPFGRFTFDDSGRAQLDQLAQDVTVDEVRSVTGWEIQDQTYDRTPVPNEEELAVIREELTNARNRGYVSVRP